MTPGMRVGELARRVGISTDVLRVWERRFALFAPERTPSGYRLYTAADERRARDVLALKEQGVPLADAVRRVLAAQPVEESRADSICRDLLAAVAALDLPAATAAIRRGTEAFGVEGAMTEILLPSLRRVGDAWASGELTIAHEHFASHAIRRHVGALAPDLPTTGRRVAVLACPPGERHDIGALMLAVVLGRRGWAVRFLGGDTPVAAVAAVAAQVDADVVVLALSRPDVITPDEGALGALARRTTVAIGGPGATPEVAESIGARLLPADPVLAGTDLDRA